VVKKKKKTTFVPTKGKGAFKKTKGKGKRHWSSRFHAKLPYFFYEFMQNHHFFLWNHAKSRSQFFMQKSDGIWFFLSIKFNFFLLCWKSDVSSL
jgi:hypothetical protein